MKLIATDLDGTLLNEHGVVSEENVAALKKAIENNIEIVIATGRSYLSASKLLKEAGISCPIICLNGAEIRTATGLITANIALNPLLSKRIIETCQNEDVYYNIYTNHGNYTKSHESLLDLMVDFLVIIKPDLDAIQARTMAEHYMTIEELLPLNIDELFSVEDLAVYKIDVLSADQEILTKISKEFASEPDLAVTSSVQQNIEFNDYKAKKGLTLRNFAEQIGVKMEEVMAIGDSYNDVSMLQMAGRGVAMGNADEEIKAISKYVTKTNVEHGVAFAIEQLFKELKLT